MMCISNNTYFYLSGPGSNLGQVTQQMGECVNEKEREREREREGQCE